MRIAHELSRRVLTASGREQLLARANARVDGLNRLVEGCEREIGVLRTQIGVMEAELTPPVERHATGDGPPDLRELDLGQPSFVWTGRMYRRHHRMRFYQDVGFEEPVVELSVKTGGREWAQAHGVRVAELFGRWRTPQDIPWDALPDRFVVKRSRGGGAMWVYPVERRGNQLFDLISGHITTPEEITEQLSRETRKDADFFAEELLTQRGREGLPTDYKAYCFYGEVGYIQARSGAWSRKADAVKYVRTFLPDGEEVFNIRAMVPRGDSIVAPHDFEQLTETARKLSRSIRRPFVRLDFYETDHGIVFGEVTHNPGRPPALPPEWDLRMGEMYEAAAARMLRDMAAEGHVNLTYGDRRDEAMPETES